MKTLSNNIFIALIVYLFMAACEPKPKAVYVEPIIGSESLNDSKNSTDTPATHEMGADEHMVKVEEVLNTDKYTYLNVTEEDKKFWVAIPRKEIEIGGTYYFKGGLLKKNFESKEFKRVFETLYLASDVSLFPINTGVSDVNETSKQEIKSMGSIKITHAEGVIKLSELFSDPGKFQGKLIQVTGKCVKVNPMIMNRNWIHIQDGSGDGLDLTVTTTENLSLNAIVTMEGTIAINKDFGAGYKYDVIMEKAILK